MSFLPAGSHAGKAPGHNWLSWAPCVFSFSVPRWRGTTPWASYTSGQSSSNKPNSRCFLKPLLKTGCPHFYPHHSWSEQAHGKAQSQVGRKESTGHCLLGSMAKRVDEWLRTSTTIHHQCKLSQNKPNQQNHHTERLNPSMGGKIPLILNQNTKLNCILSLRDISKIKQLSTIKIILFFLKVIK